MRILAATNKRLEEEVENGIFREDLFYRLNVVRIHIPPLRQRVEDIRLLAEHFLHRQNQKGKVRSMQFSDAAVGALEAYHWPGNVRELENLIQRACVLATGNVLLPEDLPMDHAVKHDDHAEQASKIARAIIDLAKEREVSPVDLVMKELATVALEETKGDEGKAAKLLGLTAAKLKPYLPS